MEEIRIRPLVWPHMIIVTIALGLAATPFWFFFLKEDPIPPDTAAYIITIFMGALALVVLYFALKLLILRPDVILVNGKGFEYNPGGVSSGFIPWSNVQEVKRVAVRATAGNAPGMVWETTLAVKLKDPAPYRKQYNSFIRGLMSLNDNLYDADLFIRISSLGKEAERVERLMMQYSNSFSMN